MNSSMQKQPQDLVPSGRVAKPAKAGGVNKQNTKVSSQPSNESKKGTKTNSIKQAKKTSRRKRTKIIEVIPSNVELKDRATQQNIDKDIDAQAARPFKLPQRDQRTVPTDLTQLKDKARKKSYKIVAKESKMDKTPIMEERLFTSEELPYTSDIPRNFANLTYGTISSRPGWSITPTGWQSTTSIKETVPSEHPLILVRDNKIPIPNLFASQPVGYYNYTEYNNDQLKAFTQIAFTTPQAKLFYAIRNYSDLEPTRFALMVMLLPWIRTPTREEVIMAIKEWPLDKQASMNLYNLASMLLSKFQRNKPISYSTNITDYNKHNGFILGSEAYHRYKAPKVNDILDPQTFTFNTIVNHPVVARYVDKLVDVEYDEYTPIFVQFDGGKPTPSSQIELDWYRIPWRNLTKEQIIDVVAKYNSRMHQMDACGLVSTIGYNIIDSICDHLPENLRPKRTEDIPIMGECSTVGSEYAEDISFEQVEDVPPPPQTVIEPSFKPNNLIGSRSKGPSTHLFYQSQSKSKDKDYYTRLKAYSGYPESVTPIYRTTNKLVFDQVFSMPPPQGFEHFFQAADRAFKISTTTFPTGKATYPIRLHSLDPDDLKTRLTMESGDYVEFAGMIENPDKTYTVHIRGPNVESTKQTVAFFAPQYYPPPYLVDNVMFRYLFESGETGRKTIDQLNHFRRCAGCPMGQVIRYGKEITVNKEYVTGGTIDLLAAFRPTQLNIAIFSIQFLKDVWFGGSCVINDKSSSGMLYTNQKKSLLTTLLDIAIINKLRVGSTMDIPYQPWMGAHQFKPKYEVTDMDKFSVKTRSIFVGNSFIQTLMTPLFQGVYDFNYDYDDPVGTLAAILYRKHCLGVTQQKFLTLVHNLTEEQKQIITGAFRKDEFLFAYSDNVYYLNVKDGSFLSLDGVAMESQVRESHIDKAFEILELYDDQLQDGVLVDQSVAVGNHQNPYYDRLTMTHNQPLDATGMELLSIYTMFPDFEYINIQEVDGQKRWVTGLALNRKMLQDLKRLFKQVFNGSVHAGTMQAPLGFLPSGWYITTLLNTIVSLEFIAQAEDYAQHHNCSLYYVATHPSDIKSHNFTLENDTSTNIYAKGRQNTDFLGFNLVDGVSQLRWSGLYPSVFFYSAFSKKKSATEKLAQKVATWISALFNGGVSDPLFMDILQYELKISFGDQGVVPIAGQHLDDGLIGIIDWLSVENLQDVVDKAAQFCGMSNPPEISINNLVRFRYETLEEISMFDIYKELAFPVSIAIYLDGSLPFNPTHAIRSSDDDAVALEQLRTIKATADCYISPKLKTDLQNNPVAVTISQKDNTLLKERAAKVLEIIKSVPSARYIDPTSNLPPPSADGHSG